MYFHHRNKRKWTVNILIFSFLLIFGWGSFVSAQDTGTNDPLCPENAFAIVGPEGAKINVESTYRVMSEESRNQVSVTYKLLREDNWLLSTSTDSVLPLTFDKLGNYILQATVIADKDCTYDLLAPITVYTTIYTYIGPQSDEIGFAHDALTNTWVLMKELLIGDDTVWAIDQQMSALFSDSAYYIQHADSLLIDNEVLASFLEQSSKLEQFLEIDLSNKDVYVFADISQSAFRRMTARYRDLVGIDTMYVVEKKFMGSFLTPLLLGRSLDTLDYVKVFSTTLEDSNKWLPVSYLVDYLLQWWFPIDTLIMILLLSFLVLVVSFAAQVVWLNVFGVFNPLLFGLSLYILGPALTIILFVAAFVTMLLVKRFTDKIYLLYSAKVALIVVVYSMICLLFFGLERLLWYGRIDYSMFHAPMILFPVMFIIMVGKTVFSEKFYLFGKGRRQWLLEFILMSLFVYWLVQWEGLQNFLLGYPESLIAIFVLTIVVGRFTGLQIFEYIRFLPLIKEYFEEEEE